MIAGFGRDAFGVNDSFVAEAYEGCSGTAPTGDDAFPDEIFEAGCVCTELGAEVLAD